MKKLILATVGASALILGAAAVAGGPDQDQQQPVANPAGFYVGANLGAGSIDNPEYNGTDFSLKNEHFVWGVDAGYQFNQYLAIEAGYLSLPSQKLTEKDTGTTTHYNQSAVYLAAKGIYPVADKVNVFGKAGIAYRIASAKDDQSGFIGIDGTNKLSPLFAVGVSYDVTNNIALDVTGTTILKNTDQFKAAYLGTAGVSYKFAA